MPQYKVIHVGLDTTTATAQGQETQMRKTTAANNPRTTSAKTNRKTRDPRAANMRATAKARQHDFRKGGFRR